MRAPRDTSPEIWARAIAGYRALTPQARAKLALDLSEDVIALSRAGIMRRHPAWRATEVEKELARVIRSPSFDSRRTAAG